MNATEFHARRKFADTSFGRIAYVDHGTGPATLFIHGLPLCSYEWRDVIEDLAPTRRCLALDQLGLGYTDVAAGQDVSFASQAGMIAAFLEAVNIPQVDLVGNDTGAGVCQLFAATYPAHVRSLTRISARPGDRQSASDRP